MKITIPQAKRLSKLFNIDHSVVSFEDWKYGLNVELEHGKKFGTISNITNDKLEMTAKIVLAHLQEYPDYYSRLRKMEIRAEKFWENKKKKSIFL